MFYIQYIFIPTRDCTKKGLLCGMLNIDFKVFDFWWWCCNFYHILCSWLLKYIRSIVFKAYLLLISSFILFSNLLNSFDFYVVILDESLEASLSTYLKKERQFANFGNENGKPLTRLIVGDEELYRRVFMVFYRM